MEVSLAYYIQNLQNSMEHVCDWIKDDLRTLTINNNHDRNNNNTKRKKTNGRIQQPCFYDMHSTLYK